MLAESDGGPQPKCGDKVVVHYTGSIASSKKVFDDSRERGFAMTFPVGVGKVIQGWDDAVASMRKGDRHRLLIPSEHAYGPAGRPPLIPPNADLVFDIEVVNINETLVEEGMRIKREESARADRFLKMKDEENAARAEEREANAAGSKRRREGEGGTGSGSDDSDSSGSSSGSESGSESSSAARKRRKKEKKKKEKKRRKREKKERRKKEKREREDKGEKRAKGEKKAKKKKSKAKSESS